MVGEAPRRAATTADPDPRAFLTVILERALIEVDGGTGAAAASFASDWCKFRGERAALVAFGDPRAWTDLLAGFGGPAAVRARVQARATALGLPRLRPLDEW